MNPDIKRDWVAALRSGKYQQGHGVLREDDEYCCLGVLCDLAAEAGVGSWSKRGDGVYGFYTGDRIETGVIPLAVSKWAGMGSVSPANPLVVGATKELHKAYDALRRVTLSALNDGNFGADKRDFKEIADIIEAQL